MQKLNAILRSIQWLADGIHSFEFRPLDGQEWPPATAGAHIDVHLPNGLVRSYSLTNRPDESNRYRVVVSRDASGTGGSKYMHDSLRVGQKLQLSAPRNNFPLKESATSSVFIGGGIGITPIWSMVQRLAEIGAPWVVHYSARTRQAAALVDELEQLAFRSKGTVHLNFDGGSKERMLDLEAIVASAAPGSDFYCCGPVPMLKAFSEACKDLDDDKVHLEYFAAPLTSAAEAGSDQAFNVVLTKSDKVVSVGACTSILDALLAAGVDAPYSCMGGVCRACVTTVVSGIPDHRDFVLSDAERESGDKIILCCSRAKSKELVLDL
jgi:vanillate O-demethylase ferredoxin subunit